MSPASTAPAPPPDAEAVLAFWFPPGLDADEASHLAQLRFWFQGGADEPVAARFVPTIDAASRGALDAWATTPRGRLALILVLDQFRRNLYRGAAESYALDDRALALTLDGLQTGMYDELEPVWEKMFFILPLGHSEKLAHHDVAAPLIRALVADAPEPLRKVYEFAAAQAKAHRDVIARFGRHPHRNQALGRASTPEELAYLTSLER